MLSFLFIKMAKNYGVILKSGGYNVILNKCANEIGYLV